MGRGVIPLVFLCLSLTQGVRTGDAGGLVGWLQGTLGTHHCRWMSGGTSGRRCLCVRGGGLQAWPFCCSCGYVVGLHVRAVQLIVIRLFSLGDFVHFVVGMPPHQLLLHAS